jgi:hypothetical protein
MTAQARSPRTLRFSRSLVGLGVAAALTLGTGMDTATAAGPPAPSAKPVTHLSAADSYVVKAVRDIRARHYYRARAELAAARSHITQANAQARALIGRPPRDPESDDLPGPPAVIAVLGLDSRVTARLLPLFNALNNPKTVAALGATVATAQIRRDTVLNPVFALPPEGDADAYADGLTDTLPVYGREVASIAHALAAFHLSPPARPMLDAALARARATTARMNAAYGGGERQAPTR